MNRPINSCNPTVVYDMGNTLSVANLLLLKLQPWYNAMISTERVRNSSTAVMTSQIRSSLLATFKNTAVTPTRRGNLIPVQKSDNSVLICRFTYCRCLVLRRLYVSRCRSDGSCNATHQLWTECLKATCAFLRLQCTASWQKTDLVNLVRTIRRPTAVYNVRCFLIVLQWNVNVLSSVMQSGLGWTLRARNDQAYWGGRAEAPPTARQPSSDSSGPARPRGRAVRPSWLAKKTTQQTQRWAAAWRPSRERCSVVANRHITHLVVG